MDTQQLEKLKKLKDKGAITEEEYNLEKKKLLDANTGTSSSKRTVGVGIIILLIVMIVGGAFLQHSSGLLNFACDESTMKFAEDLINETYSNFNNTFRLSDPVEIKQSKNYLKCKVKTNFYREFPEIYYELDKQSDGTILVHVNPYGDKFQQELDKAQKEIDSAVQDFEQEMMRYSY